MRIYIAALTYSFHVKFSNFEVHIDLPREDFRYGLTRFYKMVKRRPTTNNELRTNNVSMSVHRYTDLDFIKAGAKQYWNIEHIQPFFPPIEKLFKTDELDSAVEYGIRFESEVGSIQSENTVRLSNGTVVPIHRKTTMILSPFKWMEGEYGTTFGLPTTLEQSMTIHNKIQNPNNYSYVGAILSAALSESGCNHFPKVYGLFSGISQRHTIDISDDYEELCERSWFTHNIGKTFEVKLSDIAQSTDGFRHTRKSRAEIQLGDDILLEGVQELETLEVENNVQIGELKAVFKEDEDEDETMSDSSSVSTSYVFNVNSCACEEDDDTDLEDDTTDDVSFAWASFSNVPVQITVMEQCAGTLYKLMVDHPESEKHTAWMAQVIFALAFAQRNFAFTHNDLHANNVMYVPTDKEYLYYNCSGTVYRVPTHGFLIKIIDFERSIGSVRLSGMKEPKLFMSDHFSANEEAGGQYNSEPFYVSKYPSVKPNPSFDLARLATSLFWDLFPEGPDCKEYTENVVFQMFVRWMGTGDGKSVLFGKNEASHERYHGFHLYKAIARFCKDAIPRKEILQLKSLYGFTNVPLGENVCSIDI